MGREEHARDDPARRVVVGQVEAETLESGTHSPPPGIGPLDERPRTEAQVTADTAWALLDAGAIDGRTWSQSGILALLGLSEEDLREARRRYMARGRVPLEPTGRARCADASRVPDDVADTDRIGRPIPSKAKAAGRPGQKWCPRCKTWKTLKTDFDRRGPNETRPRAFCRGCYADYQRERYLSVAAERRGSIAATFIVEPHDGCCGTPCLVCRLPLAEGDLAAVRGDPLHEECRVVLNEVARDS